MIGMWSFDFSFDAGVDRNEAITATSNAQRQLYATIDAEPCERRYFTLRLVDSNGEKIGYCNARFQIKHL